MFQSLPEGKELGFSLLLLRKFLGKTCFLLLLFLFHFNSCTWLRSFFEEDLEFESCDSTHSLYDGENYYFHRDFVRENGQLDQGKWWFEAFRLEASPCNPLPSPSPSKRKK